MVARRSVGRIRVGISGWRYPGWRGSFYPEGLPQRRELEYAASRLDTVEINGSFYSLQRPEYYRRWYDETPPDFVFAVKGSRFITHMKKLRDVEAAVANFFASGVLRLADKLGPMLWQFPARMPFEAERFESFLELLPRTHAEAAAVGERHDHRVKGRSWLEPEHRGDIRHAFEIRHESFLCPAFMELLREHGAALVFADAAGDWAYAEDVTAEFLYLRLHGAEELYASGYTDEALDGWAAKLRKWAAGQQPAGAEVVDTAARPPKRARDAYVYFDNDAKVRAPFDAIRLRELLGLPEKEGATV